MDDIPDTSNTVHDSESATSPANDSYSTTSTTTSPITNSPVTEKRSPVHKLAVVGLIAAAAMPFIGLIESSLTGSQDSRQYGGLLLIIMAVYTVPFMAVAVPGLIFGEALRKKDSPIISSACYLVSLIASVADIVVMIAWLFNAL